MDRKQVAICAVVVTYGDRFNLLSHALRSAVEAGAAHVIIVDNGSSAPVHLLESSGISVVRLSSNGGSAVGFASGMRVAATGPWSHILLLDDDNMIDRRSLDKLVDAQLEDPETRFCAPARRLPAPDATGSGFPHFGPRASFLNVDVYERVISASPVRLRRQGKRSGEFLDLPYAPYGGLLMPRAAVDVVGLPRSDFFLYEDDSEYTVRARRLGFVIRMVPEATVIDQEGKWLRQGDRSCWARRLLRSKDCARLYYSVRNRVYFERLILGAKGPRYWLNAAVVLGALFGCIRSKRDINAMRLVARAIADGYRGKLGVRSFHRIGVLADSVVLSESEK